METNEMNKDTPETDAMEYCDAMCDPDRVVEADFARKLERERDDLQKAVNGLCEHIGVSPANTTILAVQVLRIERERDEWKAEAKRWRDMYMQFDEMLESDIKDATDKVSDIIAQVEKLSKEIDKGY
jgi:hypothetical protein